MSNEEGRRKIKKKQTTQRHKSTESVYDNKQKISLVLIITAPSVMGRNVKYDSLKKTYNTFKGEHIDSFDRTFIEKGKQWHLLSEIICLKQLLKSSRKLIEIH